MAAYSMDLRARVVADWDAGMAAKELAVKFRVSRSRSGVDGNGVRARAPHARTAPDTRRSTAALVAKTGAATIVAQDRERVPARIVARNLLNQLVRLAIKFWRPTSLLTGGQQ